jgi:hypothetical protein
MTHIYMHLGSKLHHTLYGFLYYGIVQITFRSVACRRLLVQQPSKKDTKSVGAEEQEHAQMHMIFQPQLQHLNQYIHTELRQEPPNKDFG